MKKIAALLLVCLITVMLIQPMGLAWMSDNGLSSPIYITSNVHKTYFHSGDGSKGDPYVIAAPVQLYYFAWLQYLGYFNTDENGNDKIDSTVYFKLLNDIDMTGYTIPPIGTTDNPFIGNFDGADFTVKNVTIENHYSSLIEPPDEVKEGDYTGVEIIGFFGVVGYLPEDKDKYEYETSANEVKNLALSNITVKTQTDPSLIGLVAGYVNGYVDRVGVIGGTVHIDDGVKALSYTANISDYSLIGYCMEGFRDDIYIMDVVLSNPGTDDEKYTVVPDMTAGDDGQGWGGSVKMSDIYSVIQNASSIVNYNDPTYGSYQSNFGYLFDRTDFEDLNGLRVTLDPDDTTDMNVAQINNFGSFIFSQMSMGSSMDINFVSGSQRVTYFKYTKNEENTNVPLYNITDGSGNYLSLSGTTVVRTDEANATDWYVEGNDTDGYVVYALIGTEIYYLNKSGTNVVLTSYYDVDWNNLPTWKKSGNTYAIGGHKLEYADGSWKANAEGVKIYVTSGGTTNYLRNNGTNLQNTTDSDQATIWTMTQSGNGYTFSVDVNGTTYYLRSNNSFFYTSLQLSTTSTAWTCTDTQIYYNNYYLQYYNNTWTIRNSSANVSRENYVVNGNISISQSQDAKGVEIKLEKTVYVDNSSENSYYDENGELKSTGAPGVSYLPLSFSQEKETGKYIISNGNTGYIVSSKYGDLNNVTDKKPNGEIDDYGNIRISRYAQSTNLPNYLEPYAISYKTGGIFKTVPNISDDPEEVSADDRSYIVDSLGLQKYESCIEKFRESVTITQGNSSTAYCYGLHFMEATVMKENVTEITATILGKTISNYQVPTNCIDFNLHDRGFVNCFAGSYYTQNPGNDSFFSIYEIERDSTGKKITEIKEIYKIYGKLTEDGEIDTETPYIYTYKGLKEGGKVGNVADYVEIGYDEKIASLTDSDEYVVIFDCLWIIHPDENSSKNNANTNYTYDFYDESKTETDSTSDKENQWRGPASWANQKAFYFEVPLNEGEYAIGSSAGRTGAYLIYLDLAANAQVVERYKEYEEIVENSTASSVPDGVDMLAPGATLDTVDPYDSAFVSINTVPGTSAESGGVEFKAEDGSTITHSATSGTSAEYIGDGITLKDGKDKEMSVERETATIVRTTYRDYNKSTKETTVTTITATTIGDVTTYKRTIVVMNEAGEIIDEDEDEESSPDTPDPDEQAEKNSSPGDDLIRLYFTYDQKANLTVEYTYVPLAFGATATDENRPAYYITITKNNPGDEKIKIKATILDKESDFDFYFNGELLEGDEIELVIPGKSDTGGEDSGDQGETPAG